ncbi:MAG TPA: acyltransferase family protein [Syntrophorhabdaceae bacterium]|jgi:peptidoglycan/LPS O-acetylase OafA/YrhL
MRLYFIDNIRIILTILVVLHHVALTYGASKGWYYYQAADDGATKLILTTFLAVNRTFFMGFFFMISGYFTPGSYERKGAARFARDRLLRLGLPFLFYACFIRPAIVYVVNINTLGPRYSFWANILEFRNVAPGPLWFVEVLLVLSGLYMLWRLMQGKGEEREQGNNTMPGIPATVWFAFFLGLATFAVRIWFPPSVQIFYLRIGNYAQYISLYLIGVIAYRRGWITGLTGSMGRFWIAITSIVLVAYVVMVGTSSLSGTLSLLAGGLHWQSLVSAMMESFLCIGMTISLLFVFRRVWNFQGVVAKAMADDAYTVYIMHAPIIVALAYCAYPLLQGTPLVKFCAVSVVGVALSFLISHYIRKLPLAKHVL